MFVNAPEFSGNAVYRRRTVHTTYSRGCTWLRNLLT